MFIIGGKIGFRKKLKIYTFSRKKEEKAETKKESFKKKSPKKRDLDNESQTSKDLSSNNSGLAYPSDGNLEEEIDIDLLR